MEDLNFLLDFVALTRYNISQILEIFAYVSKYD